MTHNGLRPYRADGRHPRPGKTESTPEPQHFQIPRHFDALLHLYPGKDHLLLQEPRQTPSKCRAPHIRQGTTPGRHPARGNPGQSRLTPDPPLHPLPHHLAGASHGPHAAPDRRRVDHDATLEHPDRVLAGRKVPRSHGGSRGGAAEGDTTSRGVDAKDRHADRA